MELEKKTTILFPLALHAHLAQVAKAKHVSIGYLVRSACEKEYGAPFSGDRRSAVAHLRSLALPVSPVDQMKREASLNPDLLLP